MRRRQFFHTMGALAGGMLVSKPSFASSRKKDLVSSLGKATSEEMFWRLVREQFIFPRDYAYMNTGGIGAMPAVVLNEVNRSMNESQIYPRPGHDHKRWDEVKEKCAGFLGPDVQKEEVAFTNSATQGINIVLNGLNFEKGDEIISSMHEHVALHVPLLNMKKRVGVKVKFFEPDRANGLNNVNRINDLITRRTKLIFISHVTCTTGQLFPIKEIGELARSKKIWFAVDGAQSYGARPIDVKADMMDFYAGCGHKWALGPKRTGVLYVPESHLDALQSTVVGAYSDGGYDIFTQSFKLHPTAQRYEYATENESLFHGLGRAVDMLKTIGQERMKAHNYALADQLYAGLRQMSHVDLLSPEEKEYRTSMITFKIKDKDYRKVAGYLTEKKRYRVRVVPEADLGGIRVSLHLYNNAEEVAGLLKEIEGVKDMSL